MKITILTLFPEMFDSLLGHSIIKRAIARDLIRFDIVNIRDFTTDKHRRVDNPPVGGGAGLIMMCQPVLDALKSVRSPDSRVILTSPKGAPFRQNTAEALAREQHLIFICGHYEGMDERIASYADESLSIGDFVLTGGELPVMAMTDAIIRLIPGVIREESVQEETFTAGLLEYPQYTLPYEYDGQRIPDILFSGNHTAIEKWRRKQSLRLTRSLRPDMFEKLTLSKQDRKLLEELENPSMPEWEQKTIEKGKKFMKK